VLEARDRVGGRIHSAHDRFTNTEIPLGAEFIQGKSDNISLPLQEAGVPITEVGGTFWCASGEGICQCDFFELVDAILKKMDDHGPDESFLDFLNRQPTHDRPAKKHAFNMSAALTQPAANRAGWTRAHRRALAR
jgi:hypothetical protein